jgi:hypothetical protein
VINQDIGALIALNLHFPVLISEGDFSVFTVDGNASFQHWPHYLFLEGNSVCHKRRISQPFHIARPFIRMQERSSYRIFRRDVLVAVANDFCHICWNSIASIYFQTLEFSEHTFGMVIGAPFHMVHKPIVQHKVDPVFFP